MLRCEYSTNRSAFGAAFSLVELVLVLGIMATVAAIAVPRYVEALSRYRVESAARRVAADLELARSEARNASEDRTVSFDLTADAYELLTMDDPDHPGERYIVSSDRELHGVDLAISNGSAGLAVTFNGYGAPAEATTIQVTAGDFARTVRVEAQTGRVTIQ